MKRWYFLDDAASTGAANMAVDEYLLDQSGKWEGSPVLRLYSFDPPAITTGFHQDPHKVIDIEAARRDGIDVVKRITGGRALLQKSAGIESEIAEAAAAATQLGLGTADVSQVDGGSLSNHVIVSYRQTLPSPFHRPLRPGIPSKRPLGN